MLGNVPKIAVSEYFESEDALPYDNAEAGLGDPAEITGSYVDSVAVESGTIIITYGNDANVNIAGLSMFLVPEPLPGGGIEWSCDRGDIEQRWAPSTCR